MFFYTDPSRANDPHAQPNAETFYVNEAQAKVGAAGDGEEPGEVGWYYWPCFPGCLPDGPAVGPFNTENEAIDACVAESNTG